MGAQPPDGPLTAAVVAKLPAGVFYLLAGHDPTSFNLWEVSRSGGQRELTHNRAQYGISSFGASSAGIVLADASNGVDELGQLTRKGIELLPAGHVSSPSINSAGLIVGARAPLPNSPQFEIIEQSSFTAQPKVVYSSTEPFGEPVLGPNSSIAFITSPHPPGISGPAPAIVILNAAGVSTTLKGVRDPSGLVWSDNAPAIAVATWTGASKLVSASGEVRALPSGWMPLAWDPSGSSLLMDTPHGRLGVWQVSNPATVTPEGSATSGTMIGGVVWLTNPVVGS